MRFEVDRAMEPGTHLDIRATLPGAPCIHIHASGHVVCLHDDGECPGPIRMGMVLETFRRQADQMRLSNYLETGLMAA